MDDLVRWLGVQLDEDEQDARARRGVFPSPAVDEHGTVWLHVRPGGNAVLVRQRDPAAGYDDLAKLHNWADAENGWTQDRVLREIEAKRKIIDGLLPDLQHADRLIEGEWGSSDNLADRLIALLLAPYPKCGAATVFWPDEEACDAVCVWPRGHGGTRHNDESLGDWDEGEVRTTYPE